MVPRNSTMSWQLSLDGKAAPKLINESSSLQKISIDRGWGVEATHWVPDGQKLAFPWICAHQTRDLVCQVRLELQGANYLSDRK